MNQGKSRAQWRLILDGEASGPWDMAVDEALLLSAGRDDHAVPVLRFYGWAPPTLSIGRFQKLQSLPIASNIDVVPWVRRPTGGRAVWHEHEVTYALVVREEMLPRDARSVVGSYRWLSQGFLQGLAYYNVQAVIAPGEAPRAEGKAPTGVQGTEASESLPNCFDSATRADFVVDGRKLLGAAQCRQGGAVLQHGSLLLDADPQRWRETAGGSIASISTLRGLGLHVDKGAVQEALCRGVEEAYGIELVPDKLTAAENSLAKLLLNEKYAQAEWNMSARWRG